MAKTYSSEGIVLKRRNFSEADRLVTIYTKEQGKITAIAKGVRKPTSRKKGALEPGTLGRYFFARGKSLDILTQTEVINSFTQAKTDLTSTTQTLQLLEIADTLTPDNEANRALFNSLLQGMHTLAGPGAKKTQLLLHITAIINSLGFGPPDDLTEAGLKQYIEELANRKLKSKKFLTTSSFNVQ